jgi:UDP-GlcNAc:undecaprenyl-phosphate GlcNAc-1-phosphate transferase
MQIHTVINGTFLSFLILSFAIFFIFLNKRMKIARFLKIIDRPVDKRKIHKTDTPLTGAFSILIIFTIWGLYNLIFHFNNALLILFFCSIVIFFIGLNDDKYNLGPYSKLFILSLVLLFFLSFNEIFVLEKIYFSSFNKVFFFGEYFKIFITILCLLLLFNALNLADGINSLANMLSSIWLIYLLNTNSNYINVFLFLPLFFIIINNYYIFKGKYFLGDSGSLFLSSIVGLTAIYNYNTLFDSNPVPVENIFIIFMIPGFDMLRLFIERILNKQNPFMADKNHLHHFLINFFSLKQTLIIYFFLTILPIAANEFTNTNEMLIISISLTIYLILIILLKFFFNKNKR